MYCISCTNIQNTNNMMLDSQHHSLLEKFPFNNCCLIFQGALPFTTASQKTTEEATKEKLEDITDKMAPKQVHLHKGY